MKKLIKILAACLVAFLGGLFLYLNGNRHEQPDNPEPIETPIPASAPVALSELMEIPALTTGGRIVQHGAFVSSYNTETLIPDWVAYELTAEETGGSETREGPRKISSASIPVTTGRCRISRPMARRHIAIIFAMQLPKLTRLQSGARIKVLPRFLMVILLFL